jgi:predicted nucleic acid-binding protein
MSGNRQFVDTNVLVYAYDVTAGDKHSRARALVEELWNAREGCVSVQVLRSRNAAWSRGSGTLVRSGGGCNSKWGVTRRRVVRRA